MAIKDKTEYGAAGEFYVAGKLAEQDYSVCMAARGGEAMGRFISLQAPG
ncbi:MAG: hypothetical protein LBK08_07645 [Treponema sp.]|jgi:hypothetical protein|nr:hypothetical protein [Treponema sp.]